MMNDVSQTSFCCEQSKYSSYSLRPSKTSEQVLKIKNAHDHPKDPSQDSITFGQNILAKTSNCRESSDAAAIDWNETILQGVSHTPVNQWKSNS